MHVPAAASAYFPPVQVRHVAETVLRNVPAPQGAQELAPAAAYNPAAHATHVADDDAPVEALYRLSEQATQAVAPVAAWMVPAAQLVQGEAPDEEYCPLEHGVADTPIVAADKRRAGMAQKRRVPIAYIFNVF